MPAYEYPVPSFPLDVAMVLAYIPIGVLGGDPYDYTGDVSANTELAYNAIVWNDVRDKPLWSQILSENYNANLYLAGIGSQAYYWEDHLALEELLTPATHIAPATNSTDVVTQLNTLLETLEAKGLLADA
jgi:hypothetical protein